MGIFNKKPAHICEISYDDVVTYLRDLEQADYNKILKVVNIYRDADKKVKKILNIKEQPADDFLLDGDDTELGNFLEDEPPTKVKINKTEKPKK